MITLTKIKPKNAHQIKPVLAFHPSLDRVEKLSNEYQKRWANKLRIDTSLTRSLVSFQANKDRSVYRWFKYKEAFSATLVETLLSDHHITQGTLLDPFAGSGTALFAAAAHGIRAEGIELLPIGQTIIKTKLLIESKLKSEDIESLITWTNSQPWRKTKIINHINELRITRGAYPSDTVDAIERYLTKSVQENPRVKSVLLFALLCILESISYTRKDGQYLRWDYRSGRMLRDKSFDKGKILTFAEAISLKLNEIVVDLKSFETPDDFFVKNSSHADVVLHSGSCLEILQQLKSCSYDGLITSPPYCNRYDYTRTYALELAMLGVDEIGLSKLRQEMLSCTVENRAKDLLSVNPKWKSAILAADSQNLLQSILSYLDELKNNNLLNNNGIPRMVRGYFYEMACVISECSRLLKPGAILLMVNDNVRYAGVSVSVDIILSDIAEKLGYETKEILILPNGKGNSSQQMGMHGRESLRKCVYVWRKA